MNDSRSVDPQVLARHLSGEGTPADDAVVRRWVSGDPARAAELDELRRVWALAVPAQQPADVAAAWRSVARRMREMDDRDGVTRLAPGRAGSSPGARRAPSVPRALWPARTRRAGGALAAAIVVAVVGAGVASRALESRRQAAPAAPPSTTAYATGAQQRALIVLDDGSRIALAPASRILYRHGPGTGAREVDLEGEAVFTVTHDATRPFRVRAGGAVVVDIGTRFGIRAYRREPLRVAVAEGEVALALAAPGTADSTVTALRNPVYLRGGDVATHSGATIDVHRGGEVEELLGWTTGRLSFTHRRFGELLGDLERWYGLRIRVAEPALLEQRVSGQFEGESPAEVVRVLAQALHARAATRGSVVTFTTR